MPLKFTEVWQQEVLEKLDALKKGQDRTDLLEEIAQLPNVDDKAILHRRGQLCFTIGLQRSGKSTWATKWCREKPRVDKKGIIYPRAIVCADNIRLAVTGQRFNHRAEPTVFMVKDYMTEALLDRGHDVMCDGTHTTKVSIRRILEIDINAKWTLINTPVETCIERAIETEQEDLIPVLERSHAQLQALLTQGIENVIKELQEDIQYRWPNNKKITK